MNQLKKLTLPLLILVSLAFVPFHHGWADYDQTKVVEYTGEIVEFTYENPHATAKVKDGKKTWMVILAPTSRMEARGVPVDKLKKGNKLHVYGYPHKKTKDEMRAERIFVEEVKYELR